MAELSPLGITAWQNRTQNFCEATGKVLHKPSHKPLCKTEKSKVGTTLPSPLTSLFLIILHTDHKEKKKKCLISLGRGKRNTLDGTLKKNLSFQKQQFK